MHMQPEGAGNYNIKASINTDIKISLITHILASIWIWIKY